MTGSYERSRGMPAEAIKGDVARALFDAAGGMRAIREAEDHFDPEADRLYGEALVALSVARQAVDKWRRHDL